MKNCIIVLSLFFINFSVFGTEYFCHIDITPKGTTLNQSNINNYIRKFKYNSVPSAKGKRVRFQKYEVVIFNQGPQTSLIIKFPNSKNEVKTSYDLSQKTIKFISKDKAEIKCVTKELKKTDAITSAVHKEMLPTSDLSLFGSKVLLKNKATLRFKYKQRLVSGLMRPIIFQNGKLLTADDIRDSVAPWCVFQIQVKLNEDTYMQKYTKMKPLEFSKVSNNDTRTVFNYSFVDFSSGKKSFETSRYALFSFSCNLEKGKTFTPATFHEITGQRFELSLGN